MTAEIVSTRLVEKDAKTCLSETVYETVIPRNIRLSEAASHEKPILLYDKNCPGELAYINMTKEFLRKEKINQELARY